MKKKKKYILLVIFLIIVATVVVVAEFGLVDSLQLNNNIDVSEEEGLVEIYNITVQTKWTTGTFLNIKHHVEDGFYMDIDYENANMIIYEIRGRVKNVAGRLLNHIRVSAKLYDFNGNYLGSSNSALEYGVSNLPNTYTGSFLIEIRNDMFKYFKRVNDYELMVIAS